MGSPRPPLLPAPSPLSHPPSDLHAPWLAALWQVHVALLAIFTGDRGTEAMALANAERTEAPPWDELAARAVDHGDEHVIKFTEACQREHALCPDPRYPAAVLAAQDRIPRRLAGCGFIERCDQGWRLRRR
jgi:hypothetical protein